MTQCAPIGINTYTRLKHLRQTLEALRRNTLAKHSDLYIYSDGPKKGDEDKVAALRAYCSTLDGFRSIHLVEWNENLGSKANGRACRNRLIEQYGRVIRMEDDIVTAKGFLEFMNGAMNHYIHDDRVISVTGYCPPMAIPLDIESDVFFLARYNAWGCGYWARSRSMFPESISTEEYRRHGKNVFARWGSDLPKMIDKVVSGTLDAQDVRNMFYQATTNTYTVYPRKSLVRNIGFDGSGVHCGVTDRFEVALWEKEHGFSFGDVTVDERIVRAHQKFRRWPLHARVMNRLRQFMGSF